MGGWSQERDVSLESGQAVINALTAHGYQAIPFDVQHDVDALIKKIKATEPDVIFNALHGIGGEDGVVQGVLEMMDIPYTHSNVLSSALAMDKKLTKTLVKEIGIPLAEDKIVDKEDLNLGHPLPLPYVLKPICEGSSVGIYIIQNDQDLINARPKIKTFPLMAEQFISGRELTVTVLDFFDQSIKPLCVTELKPKLGFYDYDAKYTQGKTEHILDPELPDGIKEKLFDYAIKAHETLKCSMMSRSDFRYNEKDGLIFLEINTQPGMTALSLVPEQAQYCGIAFEELIHQCVLHASHKGASNG